MEETKENRDVLINPNLTTDGLNCKNENGEDIFIPRCSEQDKHCDKYTEEQYQYRQYLLKECAQTHPDMDKGIIEIMVDFYLNHPDKFRDNVKMSNYDKKHLITKG